MKKTRKTKAQIEDLVLFERKNNTFKGEVFAVRDNSVLVQISEGTAEILKYETENTVVRHEHYSIIS